MSTKSAAVHFNCPHCNALYHLVKTEAGPETKDREITCRACGGPLPACDGMFICKYFLCGRRHALIHERLKAHSGNVQLLPTFEHPSGGKSFGMSARSVIVAVGN